MLAFASLASITFACASMSDLTVDGEPLVYVDDARVEAKVRAAIGGQQAMVVVGEDALFAHVAKPDEKSAKASQLLKSGEELLLSFEYTRAAAALGEAAAVVEADPNPADVDVLTRARLLEAEAWVEAKNNDAAKDAFKKLLVLRPDVAPDATLLSPAARALFTDALTEARSAGSGVLDVKSEPSAAVVVDGVVRGNTPIALAGVPAGVHRVQVRAPGYETARIEVTVTANARAPEDVKLAPTALRRALETRASIDDIKRAAHDVSVSAVVLSDKRDDALIVRRIDVDALAPILGALPALSSEPPGVVDDGTLFGHLPPKPIAATAPPTPPPPTTTSDDGAVFLWGGAAIAGVAVVGALVTGAVLLWPKPPPETRLGVVLSL